MYWPNQIQNWHETKSHWTIHNTKIITHSLTHSWSWALLEKLPIVQLLKNFPAFYGTRRFVSVLTRALHWSLSWARSIQSIPSHPISLRFILILFTHLLISLPSCLFPKGFPTYPIFIPVALHLCYMPCPSHPPWLHHYNCTWRRVQVMKLHIGILLTHLFHYSNGFLKIETFVEVLFKRDRLLNEIDPQTQTTNYVSVLCILYNNKIHMALFMLNDCQK
jgi:hypothetical protein